MKVLSRLRLRRHSFDAYIIRCCRGPCDFSVYASFLRILCLCKSDIPVSLSLAYTSESSEERDGENLTDWGSILFCKHRKSGFVSGSALCGFGGLTVLVFSAVTAQTFNAKLLDGTW